MSTQTDKPKILVVDDETTILQTLSECLKDRYQVSLSKNSNHALNLLTHGLQPDLILLDIVMPEMTGLELCRQLKSLPELRHIPVIFVTGSQSPDDEARAFEAGAVDFIVKPLSPTSVNLRVELHLQLASTRRQLKQRNQRLQKEQNDIASILEKMRQKYAPKSSNLVFRMTPVEQSSGDILLAESNHQGDFYFLGDFTGHGLPAAVGSPYLARLFKGCVKRERSPAELLNELNRELHLLLPTGMFVCGCMIFIPSNSHSLFAWNAGLPPQYLIHETPMEITSSFLPFGIIDEQDYESPSLTHALQESDQIFLHTDGIIEAETESGDMFGQDRLTSLLAQGHIDIDKIYQTVLNHCAPCEPSDDIAMALIQI